MVIPSFRFLTTSKPSTRGFCILSPHCILCLQKNRDLGRYESGFMQGLSPTIRSGSSEPEDLTKTDKRSKGSRRYVPQKNSVAYALLITLYRGLENGNEFMRKQELIDAAEASGLSRVPIMPEMGKGKPGGPGRFAGSGREWYSGWSCMKTLVTKGLVTKSSCPAKYMLTEEGQEAARECLTRSGMAGPVRKTANAKGLSVLDVDTTSHQELDHSDSGEEVILLSTNVTRKKNSLDIPEEYIGQSYPVPKSTLDGFEASRNVFSLPPLSFGERFEDAYEVILVLDDREQFATRGSRPGRIIENVRTQFKIKIEVRRLPVGDGIWIARHKHLHSEYVLDFIVERKKVDDLRCSIRDNRYRDQKLRLLRCGLKKLIYLVEGDPNCSEAAESIKTACFTTEILEGFDVQRTSGLADTLKKYVHLTQAITQYYKSEYLEEQSINAGVCPSFDEFIKRCQDLDKMTVSDIFAIQLMQVPQVTEEVAIAVLDLYPTLLSLARAYSRLEGDVDAQEKMLKTQSNNVVNAGRERTIALVFYKSCSVNKMEGKLGLTKSETHMGIIEAYCKQSQVKLCPQGILRVAYQLRGACVSIQRLAMWVFEIKPTSSTPSSSYMGCRVDESFIYCLLL
ncbi:unnamed protein product [Malus baccata var. baccata]